MKGFLLRLLGLKRNISMEAHSPVHNRIMELEQRYIALQHSVEFLLNSVPQFVDASLFEERLTILLQKLRPKTTPIIELRRFGGMTDGGYVVDFQGINDASLLTFGVGDSVRFEEDISQFVKAIYAFDHTVEAYPGKAKVNFFQIGLLGGQGEYKDISLRDAINSISSKVILKMDVEGAEWTALWELDSELCGSITQLIVEFHGLEKCQNVETFENYNMLLSKITEVFVPVHINTNNNALSLYGKNCYVTSCIEVTFVNKFYYPNQVFKDSTDSLSGVNTPFRIPLSPHPLF